MTARPWAPRPKAGDIVQCRFPETKFATPGPKNRPAHLSSKSRGTGGPAYGTSQHVEQRYPGELTIRATDSKAGLHRDTKFDLGNSVRLPFDTEWFAASPTRRFGNHPKRGTLNLKDQTLKRALQAAILEAKEAGRL